MYKNIEWGIKSGSKCTGCRDVYTVKYSRDRTQQLANADAAVTEAFTGKQKAPDEAENCGNDLLPARPLADEEKHQNGNDYAGKIFQKRIARRCCVEKTDLLRYRCRGVE